MASDLNALESPRKLSPPHLNDADQRSSRTQHKTGVAAARTLIPPPHRSAKEERKVPPRQGTPSDSSDGSSPLSFNALMDEYRDRKRALPTERRPRSASATSLSREDGIQVAFETYCQEIYVLKVQQEMDGHKHFPRASLLEYSIFRELAEEQGMVDLPERLTKDDVELLRNLPQMQKIYTLYADKIRSHGIQPEAIGLFPDPNAQIETLELAAQAVNNVKATATRLYDEFYETYPVDNPNFRADSTPCLIYYASKLTNNQRWIENVQTIDVSDLKTTWIPFGLLRLSLKELRNFYFRGNFHSEIPYGCLAQSINLVNFDGSNNRIRKIGEDFGLHFGEKLRNVNLSNQKTSFPMDFPFNNFEDRSEQFTLDHSQNYLASCPDPKNVPYQLIITERGG